MKRVLAAVLVLILLMAFVPLTGSLASEPEEPRYSVTLYEDSTKSEVLYKKENQKEGNIFVITFDIYKEGHTFVSWIDADTGDEISFYNNIVTVPAKNAEYYVRWQINSYKLVYNNCGENFAEYDVVYSTPAYEMPVPDNIPEREGYEFKGWSALPATMPASDMVVTAVWKDVCTQANFYINADDSEPFASVPLDSGEKISAPSQNPTKAGYTFKGWSFDGKTVVRNLGSMGTEDVSVYAVWSPNKYTASFDANGGTFADGTLKKTFSVEYGSKIDFDEIPTAKGLIFNGWTPKVDTMHNINGLNFRANWIRKEATYYTVRTYVMGTDGRYTSTEKMYYGETGEIVNASYTIEEGFELNRPKSILTGAVKADSTLVLKVYLDRGLYDFYVNIDGVKTRETYIYGEKTAVPAEPQKDGYVFLGWEPELPSSMPATDYTVTAIWEKTDAVHIHTEKTVTVEPTCTQEGKLHKICETCGDSIGEATVIPATGHTPGEWFVVIEPTYEAEGSKIIKCLECGETLEEALVERLDKPEEPPKTDEGCKAILKIENNQGSPELDYSETLIVSATVSDMPEGSRIEWSISGEGVALAETDSDSCTVESVSNGTTMLTATLVDSQGEPLRNEAGEKISDSMTVISNAGLWQRIVAFFKKLFMWNNF